MYKLNVLSTYNSGDDVVDILLKNRGIISNEDKQKFLDPPAIKHLLKDFSPEFKNALVKAKELIFDCIKKETPIIIYGDYDSDGINATAILYKTISKELAYKKVSYFIPNRFDHGYGLSKEAIDQILINFKEQVLFITVDTGISANEAIDYLKSLGHLIILTDHHQVPDVPPTVDVLLWTDTLVGAGVSWVLSKMIGSTSSQSIGLVAIATITDLYPVMGVNRSIVKQGLEVLNTNPPVGISKLLEVSGKQRASLSTYDIGWVIGPRLNATGRLVEATDSLLLLLEDNPEKAFEYAQKLNQVNIDRQAKTLEMYALAGLEDEKEVPKVIFSCSENYHEGIIGLVASKISQKYHRPTIVISLSDGYGKGSVRSIAGIDIISLLRNFEPLFENIGGHPMAAGFSIKKENIEELQRSLTALISEKFTDDIFVPLMDVDIEIPIDLVGLPLLEDVEKLKPFGLGNSEPTFLSKNVGISSSSIIGRDGRHLSIKLYDGERYYKAVWFGGVEAQKTAGFDLSLGDNVDIVYTLSRNEYNNNVYVDIIVKDVKKND